MMGGIIILYVLAAELMKRIFYRWLNTRDENGNRVGKDLKRGSSSVMRLFVRERPPRFWTPSRHLGSNPD